LVTEAILEDLERGEQPIPIIELAGQTFMPRRNGKPLHKRVAFRWVSAGIRGEGEHPIRLEAVRTPAGLATTRAAVMRFFRLLSDPDAALAAAPTPSQRRKSFEAASRRLEAAGIK
jgi:hypothetical protein